MVERVRQRCAERGIEAALERKTQETPSRLRKLDGAAEAHLVQNACSQPPTPMPRDMQLQFPEVYADNLWPEDELAALCAGRPHIFCMLRYLPLTARQAAKRSVLWGEEHTDFNLLTLLPGGRFHDPEG